MDVLRLDEALGELRQLNPEISVHTWHRASEYEVGLIAFHPRTEDDARQIVHERRDVICQVVRGAGRLRLEDEAVPVAPGSVYRIPAGTPHDFAASGAEPLVLLYTLVTVSAE